MKLFITQPSEMNLKTADCFIGPTKLTSGQYLTSRHRDPGSNPWATHVVQW